MFQVDLQLAISIAVFSFVSAVTPGPNNTILLATGVNHGFKKALPFLFGIQTGIVCVLTLLALGLNALLAANPAIVSWLKYIGFAYIVFLAWKIVRSSGIGSEQVDKPIGFFKGVSLQFVNPKVWITMTAFSATFVPANTNLIGYIMIFGLVVLTKLPGASLWAAFGQVLRQLLQNPKQRAIFNIFAAIMLVGSMIPMVFF
ncbi:MAG: LysE family translocator [Actinobacteria bacterium]|nr:LysE family translocator [Actinomycetota bacterium]